MKKQILPAILLPFLLLLASCAPDPIAPGTPLNNQSSQEQAITSSAAQPDEPFNLLEVFPSITHLCPYDSDNILVMQPDAISLFNVKSLTKERDFTVSFSTDCRINKLSNSTFYCFSGDSALILDKELAVQDTIKLPKDIEYNFCQIAPDGKSLIYLTSEMHLMYLPVGKEEAADLGNAATGTTYLDESHAISPYFGELGYKIFDLNTGVFKTFQTTSIYPVNLCGGKLLLTEDWDTGELPAENKVTVLTTKPPFDSSLSIKMKQDVESGRCTLSDKGSFVLSYLTPDPVHGGPEKSVRFASYNSSTGEQLWNKFFKTKQDYSDMIAPIFLEEPNTIVFSMTNDVFYPYLYKVPKPVLECYVIQLGNT